MEQEEEKMDRASCLKSAESIVCSDRNQQYGDPENNFAQIANMWTAYLNVDIMPEDVAMMMIMLKIARVKTGSHKGDNYIDIAGYAACAAEIAANNEELANDFRAG